MEVKCPTLPWEGANEKTAVIGLVCDMMNNGYRNRSDIADLIGVYGDKWKEQNLAMGWSLKGLAVLAYLTHVLDGVDSLPELDPPPLLRFGEVQNPFDVTRNVCAIAHRWRFIEPSEKFFVYLNALELHMGASLPILWEFPDKIEPLQRVCDIFFSFFKTEHLYRNALSGQKVKSDPISQEKDDWFKKKVATAKQAGTANPMVRRLYLKTALVPGEDDAHARSEHGIFSGTYADILPTQRPIIASDSVTDSSHDFDVEGACGVLYFHLIDIEIKKSAGYDWSDNNLFFDYMIDADFHFRLETRKHPWILLIGKTYYIRYPKKKMSYYTTSAKEAISMWFWIFWEQDKDGLFFDGTDVFSMENLNSNFVFCR